MMFSFDISKSSSAICETARSYICCSSASSRTIGWLPSASDPIVPRILPARSSCRNEISSVLLASLCRFAARRFCDADCICICISASSPKSPTRFSIACSWCDCAWFFCPCWSWLDAFFISFDVRLFELSSDAFCSFSASSLSSTSLENSSRFFSSSSACSARSSCSRESLSISSRSSAFAVFSESFSCASIRSLVLRTISSICCSRWISLRSASVLSRFLRRSSVLEFMFSMACLHLLRVELLHGLAHLFDVLVELLAVDLLDQPVDLLELLPDFLGGHAVLGERLERLVERLLDLLEHVLDFFLRGERVVDLLLAAPVHLARLLHLAFELVELFLEIRSLP